MATPTTGRIEHLPPFLRNCAECGVALTQRDVDANSDDAVELTDGYSCESCLDDAIGYAPPPAPREKCSWCKGTGRVGGGDECGCDGGYLPHV